MAKIICESCGSSFPFDQVKDMKNCPVCGALFDDEGDDMNAKKEMQTFYYYDDGSATLTGTLYSHTTPIYIFEALDMKDAERQLKEVLPNSPLFKSNATSQTRCPRCHSTEIQLIPRKFSLLTGFATNKFDRICVRCQKKF